MTPPEKSIGTDTISSPLKHSNPAVISRGGWRKLVVHMAGMEVLGLLGACVVIFVFLSVATPRFLSVDNLSNLMREMSVLGIVAAGQTLVILRGQIDLSVGSILALSSVAAAFAVAAGWAPILVILAGLIVGSIYGLINGAITAKASVNSLIVTLGTMTVGFGIALVATGGAPQAVHTGFLEVVGQGGLGSVPYQFIIMITVVILTALMLRFTVFGRSIYASGDNERAAALNGVDVDLITIMVFVASGFFSSIGGLLLAGQFTVADPTIGSDENLKSIAAVVIGGTSLLGGVGGIGGTVLGAALMAMLANGLVHLRVASAWQEIATGVVIVLAVLFDQLRRRRRG
jgi:ribose transport system permease protein